MSGLSLGGGVRYVGLNRGKCGLRRATLQKMSLNTPGYTLFDAMIAYETPDWRWVLTVQNLADKYTVMTYRDARRLLPWSGATISAGFYTYKF